MHRAPTTPTTSILQKHCPIHPHRRITDNAIHVNTHITAAAHTHVIAQGDVNRTSTFHLQDISANMGLVIGTDA